MGNPWNRATQWVGKNAKKATEAASNQIDQTAAAIQNTAEQTAKAGQASLQQVQQTTAGVTNQVGKAASGAASAAKASLEQAQAVADKAAPRGKRMVDHTVNVAQQTGATVQTSAVQVGQQVHHLAQPRIQAMGRALDQWQTEILAAGAAGMVVTQALKDLPRTAQALAQEMPKLARRLQRAGVRSGEPSRAPEDVMALFDKIPGTSKLGGSEADIRTFLSDKHGSHIHPHAQGGGNGADNIVWELGSDNIRRGAETMTGGEQLYIRCYNAVDSIFKNSPTIASLGLKATGTAVLTQSLVTALAYALDLHRGEITVDEFRDKIVAAAVQAGVATPIFFLLFVVVMALIPEVVVVLTLPAVVAGFNSLFFVGISLPIIQSIIRHVEADGFGPEARAQYELATAQGETLLQSASEQVQMWWGDLFNPDGGSPGGAVG